MSECKRLALESIVLSMDIIKNNLKDSASRGYVEAKSKAMVQLATAFEIICRSEI